MSAAQKKVIDDHCTSEWAQKVATGWADDEFSGRDIIAKEPGHTIVKPSPADVEAWKKSAEPLQQKWADGVKKVGLDPVQVMKELTDDLKAAKSLY
jgi:hypothetical protein